jgi:zinc transport system substrate-binding protein
MKNKIFLLILVLILIFYISSLIFFFFLKKSKPTNNENKIGVSLYPIYYLAKEIGGDKVEFELIMPAGSDPHHFDLTPEILDKIQNISYVLYADLSIDFWVLRIKNINPKIKLINVTQGVDFIIQDKEKDPHFWFSLKENLKVAENIYKFLEEIDSQNKDYYKERYLKLKERIEELDKFTFNELRDIKKRKIVTQHNFLSYFARDYNFEIVGYLEKEEGELTPQEVKNLISLIKKYDIKAIFGEKYAPNKEAENFAQEYNLKVYYLDTLETGKEDFFSAYKENVKIIKEALEK